MQDREMLNELILESREHLSTIEPDLLDMERSEVTDEQINRVFRAIHSIKGGFSFFGIEAVTKLSHTMENVLSRVRDKELAINASLTDALLQGVDKLRTMLDDVENAAELGIDQEIAALEPYLSGAAPEPAPAGKNENEPGADYAALMDQELRENHPDVTNESIASAIRNGKLIYQINLDSHSDMLDKELSPQSLLTRWEKLGDVLDAVADFSAITELKGSSQTTLRYSILFATVLEPDLVSVALEIDEDQIYCLDTAKVKEQLRDDAKPSAVAPVAETVNKKSPPAAKQKAEHRVEDALRVRIGLLNNLMNLAGELVLSRNQLIQRLNARMADLPESQAIISSVIEAVRQMCENVTRMQKGKGLSKEASNREIERLEKRIRELLGFRLIDLHGVNAIVQDMDMVTSVMQENIMQTRMQPLSVVFSKFPRVIRDLSKKLSKEIELTVVGQDVELDKSIIESLSDPLTHLIRNCVDHGIERPEERERKGKPRVGSVHLSAYHKGGKVNIEIADDGKGIDPEKVKQLAVSRGVVSEEAADALSQREIQLLIFTAGFSTAENVSDVSGRGVGADVVRTNIERLGGAVELDSQPGQGTRMTLKLPLTLAIIPSLIVTTEQRRFAVPQVGLEEIVRIRARDISSKIERIQKSEVLRLRGKLLPLVRLTDILGIASTFYNQDTGQRLPDRRARWSDRRGTPEQQAHAAAENEEVAERRTGEADRRARPSNALKILVLRTEANLFGLVVDDVLDSEEIVVKPLSEYLKGCQLYSGATIMGDGKVAMILDSAGIAAKANLRFGEIERELAEEKSRETQVSQQAAEDILVFSNGATEKFGLRLDAVARIEKRAASEIETIGHKLFVKYDDSMLQVVWLHDYLPVAAPDQEPGKVFVIVPKGASRPVGIAAARVEDVVHATLSLDTQSVRSQGITGSAIIGGAVTLILELPALLAAVDPEIKIDEEYRSKEVQ
jgi:two-component system chemotaxis sensor kinase CheA